MKTRKKAALFYWALFIIPYIVGLTGAIVLFGSVDLPTFIGIFLFTWGNNILISSSRKNTLKNLRERIRSNA